MTPAAPTRLASIDILRALTMVLMIFVNDLWSLQHIPQWLEHTRAEDDGMGLADVVFPAFLVIVGMSVPLAISHRHNKGEATTSIILHIILRALALLVMGLFLVNGENINETNTGMPRSLWNSLACLSFIFIWNSYPISTDKRLVNLLKAFGWIILLILAWIYRGGGEDSLRFGTLWWGILGLIGWAYLISALVYTTSNANIAVVTIFWVLCIAYCAAFHAQLVPKDSFLVTLTSPFAHGAMPAFVTAGMLSSILFQKMVTTHRTAKLITILVIIALVLIAAGFYFRQFWGISKIRATPAWVLICSGITIASFALLYLVADVQKKSAWFNFIKPAGNNTLLCYLLPYFAYALVYGLLQTQYPEFISTGIAGLLKSLLFALIIVQLTGLLGKAGVRLKL